MHIWSYLEEDYKQLPTALISEYCLRLYLRTIRKLYLYIACNLSLRSKQTDLPYSFTPRI